jgi:hypothetical protein
LGRGRDSATSHPAGVRSGLQRPRRDRAGSGAQGIPLGWRSACPFHVRASCRARASASWRCSSAPSRCPRWRSRVTAFWLTLRVSNQVAVESARYNAYLAEKVIEAYERELVDEVSAALSPAKLVSSGGGTADDIRAALASRMRLFEAPHFVPLDELEGYSIVTVEGQLLIYGDDPTGQRDHPFASMLLSGPDGNPCRRRAAGGSTRARSWPSTCASSWWTGCRRARVCTAASSPRATSRSPILDPSGNEVAHVREGSIPSTARLAVMTGPFEDYQVRVAATPTSPVAFANRLVVIEMVFIGLLTLVLLGATFVGARYILRQIELVNAKTSFVSNVTHELKTPIAVIKVAVETLELGTLQHRGRARQVPARDQPRDRPARPARGQHPRLLPSRGGPAHAQPCAPGPACRGDGLHGQLPAAPRGRRIPLRGVAARRPFPRSWGTPGRCSTAC